MNTQDIRSPETRSAVDIPALTPPVNIVEDENGITLTADLPGASRDALSVRVDGDTLTLEAPIHLGEPAALEPLYMERRAGRYLRHFTLSGELDTTRIDARLKDGVLTLRLPKLERARPRRIEIRAD